MKKKKALGKGENTSKQLMLEQFIPSVHCSSDSTRKRTNKGKMMTR